MSENIVNGLGFDEYRSGDGWKDYLSCSTLLAGNKRGGGSMLRLKAALDGLLPRRDSDALAFGRAAHCRLLEPPRYIEEYAVEPEFEPSNDKPKTSGWKNTTDFKEQRDAWWSANEGKQSLSQHEADRIEAIAQRVGRHKAVGLIRAHGGVEVSIRGELCGVKCKARLDKLSADDTFICDLKTTRDLAPHALERSILAYSYHVKAAWYRDLYNAISGAWATWVWIFIEHAPPYDIQVWKPSDMDLRIGRSEYRAILSQYKHCLETGNWPGIAEDIEERGLPEFYVRQYEGMELD